MLLTLDSASYYNCKTEAHVRTLANLLFWWQSSQPSNMSGHSTVRIQGFVNHAEIRTQRYSLASMEDVLQEVQNLENQQLYKSRFRRLTCRLEPLIDFFIRYSPAIDMMVQYEVAPSALIWGVLKALLEVSHLVLKRAC